MKFSIYLFFSSTTKSVPNGCGSFCITNPKGAKIACSDRHQDGFFRNASPMFSRKLFFTCWPDLIRQVVIIPLSIS
jgi:hypothetical protein